MMKAEYGNMPGEETGEIERSMKRMGARPYKFVNKQFRTIFDYSDESPTTALKIEYGIFKLRNGLDKTPEDIKMAAEMRRVGEFKYRLTGRETAQELVSWLKEKRLGTLK
jgi:hypothetical protein